MENGFSIFAALIASLGATTKTNEKLAILRQYFSSAPDDDKVWAIALFTGRRPRRFATGRQLSAWCLELANLPEWLFTECYGTVGDMSETIALLCPPPVTPLAGDVPYSLSQVLHQFMALQKADEEEKRDYVTHFWQSLQSTERLVFNKLMSANFRIGVSQNLLVQALASSLGMEVATVAHHLSGNWNPATISFSELLLQNDPLADASRPYPFYLAYPLGEEVSALGEPADWQAEWKWDGIRGQLIKRQGELYVWSRGEELMTGKFPEFETLKALLPDGVCLDGEIIPMKEGKPLAFSLLQTRIGRKTISKKQLQDVPVGFIAYDLPEWQGRDIRHLPLQERRRLLEALFSGIPSPQFILSPLLVFSGWESLTQLRTESRAMSSEGLMLKRKSSPYQTGRKRGDWWKWKIDLLTIDVVLIYAQKGSGRRSSLYTDYTFAVRHGDGLVPVAKAYSGLTDKEFARVDAFIKQNSLEKFGPVRTVKAELVFELGFEGIALSKRHKSGIALRFPRMLRWRTDKSPQDINTLDDLKALLGAYGRSPETEQEA